MCKKMPYEPKSNIPALDATTARLYFICFLFLTWEFLGENKSTRCPRKGKTNGYVSAPLSPSQSYPPQHQGTDLGKRSVVRPMSESCLANGMPSPLKWLAVGGILNVKHKSFMHMRHLWCGTINNDQRLTAKCRWDSYRFPYAEEKSFVRLEI